jgi:death-on-curing protein
MIEAVGGSFTPPDNGRNRRSLEYILDAIRFRIYDRELFPTLKEKAAALAYEIISAHVFIDGCKRTGVWIAYEFLVANAVPIVYDRTVEDIAVDMARGTAGREDFLHWLHSHQPDGGNVL